MNESETVKYLRRRNELLNRIDKARANMETWRAQRKVEEAQTNRRMAMEHFLRERDKMERRPRLQINIY